MSDFLPITGIGSLPFEKSETALAFIKTHSDRFPYVPQFPKRGRFAEMTLEPFEAAADFIEPSGRASVKKGALEEMLRVCSSWEPVRQITRDFLSTPWQHSTRVKSQIIGPYTLSTQLLYAGNPVLEIDLGRALVVRRLSEIVAAECKLLREKFEKVLFVFDEPGLAFLKKKDVLKATRLAKDLCTQLKQEGLELGMHSCAPLPGDPSAALFREVGYDTISLAFEPFHPLAESISLDFLAGHLAAGKTIIWGLVPTVGEAAKAAAIAEWWLKEIAELGLPREQIIKHSALSPACGVGLLSAARATEIFVSLKSLRETLLKAL